jgi:hypothetical protein
MAINLEFVSRLGRRLLGAGLVGLLVASPAASQWRGEVWLGDAWSLSTPVTFQQINQPAISAQADWSTRPYAPAWVYAYRLARWSGRSAWAFEVMHHKIYMDNPPPGVAYLRVTNGVNFLLAERLWRRGGWEYGFGAGPILAVPVSSVRGLIYDNAHGFLHSQYELAGPGIQINLARRLQLLPFTSGSLAVKATAAYLYLHIADGHATTPNFALHLQYGLALQTTKR